MKVLFLSQRFLYPLDTGGKIRTAKILEHLSKKCEITLISNIELPKDTPYITQIKKLCSRFIPVPWKETKKYSLKFYFKLFYRIFSKYPFTVLNDYSKSLEKAILKELKNKKYDILICDFVQSALNFKKIKNYKKVLFQHNVESIIAKRHIENANNFLIKAFWWLQWKKMFIFEKKVCKDYDIVIAISEKDKEIFEKLYGLNNVYIIPTGVDTEYFKPLNNIKEKENSLVFCGSLDWLPNEDAILFFIKEIFPKLKTKIPSISLTIVGRNPSSRLKKKIKNYPEIKITGWVEDVRPYIAESAVYILPLRIGGGTRIKVYEAMAMEKAIISTSIGVEGLPVKDGKHLLIANTPDEFIEKIILLLKNKELRKKIGKTACQYVCQNFTWPIVANKFWEIIST